MNPDLSSERPLIVYGAGGVTGRLIVEAAVRAGIPVLPAGRTSRSLEEFAASHELPAETASIDDPQALVRLCRRGAVLLNAAGPFSTTALPLANACLTAGTPYIDVSGDVDAFEDLAPQDEVARSHGIAILAGAGYGVAVGECLAHHLMHRVENPGRLRLGLDTFVSQRSPGAARSTVAGLHRGGYVIRDGKMMERPLGHPNWSFRLEEKRYDFAAAPLAETWAIWSSTRIPNLTTGIRAPRAAIVILRLMSWATRALGVGSFLARRMVKAEEQGNTEGRSIAVAEVWGDGEAHAGSMISTKRDGYRVAADLAVAAAKRIAGSELAGFYTPASAFGPDFIFDIEGLERRDLF